MSYLLGEKKKTTTLRDNNICSAHKYNGFSVGRKEKQMITGSEEIHHLHLKVLFLKIYY